MAEDAVYANEGVPVASASPSAPVSSAAAMAAAVAPRGPYRGKCLYKTGKCTNERALKTSGTAHNLCDEHRRRQNEHQRKLDTKNRYARKDKRSSGIGAGGSAQKAAAAASTNAATAAVTPSPPGKGSTRYAPYEKSPTSNRSGGPHATVDLDSALKASGGDPAVPQVAPVVALSTPQQQQQSSPLHGLPVHAHTLNSLQHAQQQQQQAADTGKVFLPNGAQPPQMGYPYMVQDFDGIVVPLPSYLEGHERIEFRARIYQKVLDFISEECIRRFGGKTVADIQAGGAISSSPATVVSATVPVGGLYGAAAPVSHMPTMTTGSGSSTSSVASTPEHATKMQHDRTKEEEGESAPEEEPETAAASAESQQRPLKKSPRTRRESRGTVL